MTTVSGHEYPSVFERIAWTPVGEFHCATDKHVLESLAGFCHFKTGEAWGKGVSPKSLALRAKLPVRTVERALHRLENAHRPFIKASRRHRHATRWDILIKRLATHWIAAKVVDNDADLTATGGGQNTDLTAMGGGQLTATGGGQLSDLSATCGGQPANLTATGGGPIPRSRSPVRRREAPVPLGSIAAASAAEDLQFDARGESQRQKAANDEGSSEATARGADVRASRGDPSGRDAETADSVSLRSDRTGEGAASGAGIPVPQRSNSPRRRRAQSPGSLQQLALVLEIPAAAPEADHKQITAARFKRLREALNNKVKRTG